MKTIFKLFTLVFLLSGYSVFAQVDTSPEIPSSTHYPEINTTNDDKPLIFELEIKAAKKDSVQIKVPQPAIKSKSDQAKPSSSKEEDALSFNFLYYIIQKFKISDLVDD